MSHVAVENVHGLEQQVRRTLPYFLKKCLLHRRSSEKRYREGGIWLARSLARKNG